MAIRKQRFRIRDLSPVPKSLESVLVTRNYRRHFRAFFGLSILVPLLLVFLPWQQTAVGSGRVIAYAPNDRQQEISAPVDGRIKHWYVFEGSQVKAGDPIVDLTDNDPDILARLKSERDFLAVRVKAAETAVKTALINVERQKLLYEKGLSAKRSVEQANLEYTRYLGEEANSSAELARVDVRLSRQMTQAVTASVGGTVLRVIAGQGAQIVKAGQPLAIIVPHTAARAVEIWVTGNDMPLIREGAHVRLQFEGWPAIQFSGWPGAAVGTFGGQVALIDASDNGLGKFRVVVVPAKGERWPDGNFLRQGVRSIGFVLLSQVTLGYELWRRFNGFPPSLPEGASALLSDPGK